MAETNNFNADLISSPTKKFVFTETDKELITIALSIISSRTNQKVNVRFERNTAILFCGENEYERFNLIDDFTTIEVNKVL